jgi:hypothetical protein
MKKKIILIMLSGVLTLHAFARERYRISVKKTSDGKEIFIPAKKQHNGTVFKQWVEINNIYLTRAAAESVINEWKEDYRARQEYKSTKYIYLD